MAIYEYKCPTCQNVKEVMVDMSVVDNWLEFCIECGTVRKRLISVPGYVWAPTRSQK